MGWSLVAHGGAFWTLAQLWGKEVAERPSSGGRKSWLRNSSALATQSEVRTEGRLGGFLEEVSCAPTQASQP